MTPGLADKSNAVGDFNALHYGLPKTMRPVNATWRDGLSHGVARSDRYPTLSLRHEVLELAVESRLALTRFLGQIDLLGQFRHVEHIRPDVIAAACS